MNTNIWTVYYLSSLVPGGQGISIYARGAKMSKKVVLVYKGSFKEFLVQLKLSEPSRVTFKMELQGTTVNAELSQN